MDTGTFRGIITGLLILAFLGITAWAYSRRRKPDFDEAANLPFADEDDTHDRDHRPATRHDETSYEAGSRPADSRQDRGDRNA
ncbi:cbb3-type cytochrome oxidase subunit 3 [Billgrantia gudaonensis]|uniref:Cytochrome c oxidase cbb3-type subunit 4 n=1 Tax=Billgrantia gudaonensis TaxID=376427 RepID=A0A1G8UAD2_9GAMM|nr:cbb3-type cytochrome c oxidase subunit 3 [Halomonas gudaonensis]SDJ50709.1 cytochrome c oxidase cbb3-type subunit 4 [Halomonas gudaonensis]